MSLTRQEATEIFSLVSELENLAQLHGFYCADGKQDRESYLQLIGKARELTSLLTKLSCGEWDLDCIDYEYGNLVFMVLDNKGDN